MNANKSKGVAMLTALLLVALATLVAVAMTTRQQADIQRVENIIRMDQAWEHLFTLENWVKVLLATDLEGNDTSDSRHDSWGTTSFLSKPNGGTIDGSVADLQGRFNLNNLFQDSKAVENEVVVFKRLLGRLDLNEGIADAVLDWIDPDQDERFPEGAEDSYYLARSPAYRVANSYFSQVSELRMIKGVDEEGFQLLAPHVAALATGTQLNINSATSLALLSLADEMTEDDAESILQSQEEEAFSSVQNFLEHPAMSGREIDASRLGLTSQYFLLESDIRMGQLHLRHKSILFREKEKPVQLLQRQNKGHFDE